MCAGVRVCVKVIRTRIVNDFPRFAMLLAKFKFDADAVAVADAESNPTPSVTHLLWPRQ